MKLLVQKVQSASVEVDGMIECRIGTGVVFNLAVTAGTTADDARQLAEKAIKLKLWPELGDQDTPFKTDAVENGYEVLVVLQQSLCAGFPMLAPREQATMEASQAKTILTTFTKFLQTEYQEEMVIQAPTDASLHMETVCDTPCFFELDSDSLGVAKKPVTKAAVVKPKEGGLIELEADIGAVTKALRQIPLYDKSKATLESCRVFRVLSMRKFRSLLAEAVQVESDAFAEALEGSARYFTAKQLDQIMSWTGLTIVAPALDEELEKEAGEEGEEGEDADDLGGGNLDEQLAQLQEEVVNPAAALKRKRAEAIKQEEAAAEELVAKRRPDVRARAAPETPAAAAARQWVQSRAGARQQWQGGGNWKGGKGGKGWGKSGPRPTRQWGIASLDTSARIHGNSTKGYAYGQTAASGDRETRFLGVKEEGEHDEDGAETKKPGKAAPPRRPKGTPTLAPMTPAPTKEDL
mmetsp:Transcript_10752/g.34026  ORF Transcript_10752/g.34026 Transcript_10752/m.34026 type:complete len:465 (+) Transcript_10752:46-1440(+)|eukprot:CAMPEP_0204515588 /NCGR_PEP_ID=MMETSP0661-20131031/2698_1 /ASSEMBLY_ACC=CAM_ASM_000606 /TAXON_ID=109239 /ORGANISM="Alexandrium margalefi, Strain AMGDE01CS-322" /LENGTH=464 /DNA_ID=CAMNT_0051520913 /DNA_START=33 /DNA_END=1427 /DNA_ORIENTATION=-